MLDGRQCVYQVAIRALTRWLLGSMNFPHAKEVTGHTKWVIAFTCEENIAISGRELLFVHRDWVPVRGRACPLVWQPPIEEEHERDRPEALHDRVATVPWTPTWGQAVRIQMGLSQEPRAQERTMLPRCLCRMLYR